MPQPLLINPFGFNHGNALQPYGLYDLANQAYSLSTNTRKFAVIFQPRQALTISRLALHFNDWSFGTAPTYRISLQGVGTDGNPDGTIKAAGTAYADFTPTGTGNDGRTVWFDLGATYDAAVAERLAIVCTRQSGTADGNNHTRLSYRYLSHPSDNAHEYYTSGDGSWARDQYASPIYGFGTTTEKFGAPFNAPAYTTWNANSNPNVRALHFTLPNTLGAAFAIRGLIAHIGSPAAAKTFTATLYDSDFSTVLATETFYGAYLNRASANGGAILLFSEDPAPILLPDTAYVIALAPQENDTNLKLLQLTHDNSDCLTAYPYSPDCYLYTKNGADPWQATDTLVPYIAPLLETIYPTYPPPDADAIPDFPIVMLSASDAKTPLEGLTVTAETMIDGADFVACTNAVTEKSDGVYLIDLAGDDQGDTTTLLKFSAAGALTQFATLIR